MTDNDRTAQLERACSYLRRIPAWYLATTDVADGHQPRVRPFSFAMVDDGKFWFCTSRDKDVWAELSANPKFELSGWKPGECWIVLTGEAALEDDAVASDKVRQAGFKHMVGIGEEHESANDGRLAFFSVRNIAARFCDIDGSEERLEDISASQLRIVADLSNVMTVGSVSVPARVYLDYNSEVGVIGEYSVVVNISR